ncbi:hypothetical protein [Idiomarina abyssalis]|uniref:hypothetical protein n=1 Tax=Idiomarina abyssalis TaxID=86102 RepID=UPI003A8CC74D
MISVKNAVEGRYKFRTRKASGEITQETGWSDNIITNAGLDYMADKGALIYKCVVGSGTTPAAATDVVLENQLALTTTRDSDGTGWTSEAPFYAWSRTRFSFGEGVAQGNLSEVGILTLHDVLFSRALIVDSNGNPTTITVKSDEFLDVFYESRFYGHYPAVTDTVVINGTSHAVSIYLYYINHPSYGVAWGSQGTSQSGLSTGTSPQISYNAPAEYALSPLPNQIGLSNPGMNNTRRPYVPGSYEHIADFVLPLDRGNHAQGIAAIGFTMGSCSYALHFSPNIPKTENDILSFTFKHSWGRK